MEATDDSVSAGGVSYSPFDAWIDGNETGPATAIPAPYIMSQLEDRIRRSQRNRFTRADLGGADPWARPSRSGGYAKVGERFAGGRNDRGTWAGNSVGAVDHPADGAYRSSHAAAV